MTTEHIPIMTSEVIGGLNLRDGGIYLDGTFGRGGYSKAILEAASTRVFGIDRDPDAIMFGLELGNKYDGRLKIIEGSFGNMMSLMAQVGISYVDGITLDLGISSPQIENPLRGFSYRFDGPLDMRMDCKGPTAADFLNKASEIEIANIIFQYSEERYSRKIARGIIKARQTSPILSTLELTRIIHESVPASKEAIDPATRTFMALRIMINDELGELERGLLGAKKILSPGGRLAVVSFHSLEDRLVKAFFRKHSGFEQKNSRHMPESNREKSLPSFNLVNRRVIKAKENEINLNPRARSARLRIAERTQAPITMAGE